jgi:hypothetical protein
VQLRSSFDELAAALRTGRAPDPLPELLQAQADLAAALDVRVRADPTTALDAAVLDVETLSLRRHAAVADALAGREPSPPERPSGRLRDWMLAGRIDTRRHGELGRMKSAQRYEQVVISGLAHVDAPHVVTSAEIEAQMTRTYERLGIEAGLLEGLSGIAERRVWDAGTKPSEVAAQAGELALAGQRLDRPTSARCSTPRVPRLPRAVDGEPGPRAHGLPTEAVNFDIGNACLGFVNGMNVVASMIESGQIEHGIVVNGETSRFTMEATIDRLAATAATTRCSASSSPR